MSGKQYVRINIYLEKETADKLYDYVRKKHIRPYKMLSKTVKQAIEEFLERHACEVS